MSPTNRVVKWLQRENYTLYWQKLRIFLGIMQTVRMPVLRKHKHRRIINKIEEMFSVAEKENSKSIPQLVPILLTGCKFAPAALIMQIRKVKDLMHIKSE